MRVQVFGIKADPLQNGSVRALLTPALALANPKAYLAHFRRLELDAQRHYLGGLGVEELQAHFAATGEVPTVGLLLAVTTEVVRLEATVGGGSIGLVEGLDEAAGLQARAVTLGTGLGAKAVSGLVSSSLAALPQLEAALAALGWQAKSVVLAGDGGGADCAPALSWSVRGACPGGSFYMPSEALPWGERSGVQARLARAATRLGAVLDARLG